MSTEYLALSTPSPVDPAIANDWLAVGCHHDVLANGAPLVRRLLSRNVEIIRDRGGALSGWVHGDPQAPCAVRDHCGCIFVCLGPMPKALFSLPEFDMPGRRFISMGAIGLHTGGLRVVENFLDMAHFPFVHAHILGSEAATEVREYQVELDAHQELWARGCKFIQPMAAAASEGAADVDYVYRVVNPFSPLLYKAPADASEQTDIIFLYVQPTEEDACVVHFAISLFDDTHSAGEITAFQQTILGQDKPILEAHVYKRLPLDARMEAPSRADAGSSAYRRWLRASNLQWGIEPPQPVISAPLHLMVTAKRRVADDVVALTLRSSTGGPLPPMTPGAHLDLHLPGGRIRQYSLCNGPSDESFYTLAVKREQISRGGSAAVHDTLRIGDRLSTSLPKNNFPLDVIASRRLLVAGGIGITPLLSMARHLSEKAELFHLHYFCRSVDHVAFGQELTDELGQRITLHLGYSPDQTRDCIQKLLASPRSGTHVYTCGPAPIMELVAQAAAAASWPAQQLHFEYFKTVAPVEITGSPFELTLARSQQRVQVPADKSIVDVLRSLDIAIETNCEQGVCGTCLCTVIEGVPDHRDQYLSHAEKATNMQMLPCVSRALTAHLTLDL